MAVNTSAVRLSEIDTPWSVVLKAHQGSDDSVRWAKQTLLDRYGGAVRRYLQASLHDEEAARELFQEFALRMVRGDFRAADPERGRFRNFVKSALFHLIVDYWRREARKDQQLTSVMAVDALVTPDPQEEQLFVDSWRDELFSRCWDHLREAEQRSNTPYCSALRLLVDDPTLSSTDIAERLSLPNDASQAAGNIRVVLHRARKMFADQLVAAVADTLEKGSVADVEQELADLNLLGYCRAALDRWKQLVESPGD
jgi:RNA polymerase sigma-70 factor (ECF subfamily)